MITGTIASLTIYPVKSLAGIELKKARINKFGIEFDRNWMLIEPRTGIFMSQRRTPRMCLIQPELTQGRLVLHAEGMQDFSLPIYKEGKLLDVSVWDSKCKGEDQGDEVAEWFSDFLHQDCRMVRVPLDHKRLSKKGDTLVGFADAYPVLIVSQASLSNLNKKLKESKNDPVPMNRFRPNIVIDGCDSHAEDTWDDIRIGDVKLHRINMCARCSVVATDQDTGKRSKEPNATLVKYRSGKKLILNPSKEHSKEFYFGSNFIHLSQGLVKMGDSVEAI